MAVRDIFKISRKTFFNPGAWINFEALKQYNLILWGILQGLLSKPALGERQETFQQAMQRQGLQEADLKEIAVNYQTYAYLFFTCGVATVIFAFYLIFIHISFSGLLLALSAAALFFSQWFRFSFWHYQIVERRLGCTPKEWWQGTSLNKDKNG